MEKEQLLVLECDDFRWGLMDYGVSVSKEEAAEILNHFDKNGDGAISKKELLAGIQSKAGKIKLSKKEIDELMKLLHDLGS